MNAAAAPDFVVRIVYPVEGNRKVLGNDLLKDPRPGFAEGDVSVQDAAAQRAAECLELQDGQRVLDACAAPGGKTAHMLERAAIEGDLDRAKESHIRGGHG